MKTQSTIPLNLPSQVNGLATMQTDQGDYVQSLFAYQWAAGVALLASALAGKNDYKALWCEHHEDYLAEIQSGSYDLIQVKTLSGENAKWRNTDSGLIKAVKRFVEHDAAHGASIRKFIFLSNAPPYVPHASARNISTLASSPMRLRDECRKNSVPDAVSPPYRDALTSLSKAAGVSEGNAFKVLRKLEFQKGPPLEGFRDSLTNIVGTIPDCDRCQLGELTAARDNLLSLVAKASSSDLSTIDCFTSILLSDGRPENAIRSKCITVDAAYTALSQANVNVALSSSSFDTNQQIASPSSHARHDKGMFEHFERMWRPGLGDAALLRPEQAAIEFQSEADSYLNTLISWANSPTPNVSLQILAGSAGSGKTRLLLETCARLRKAGWETGFLRSNPPSDNRTEASQWWNATSTDRFVVIDYAEARPAEVTCQLEVLFRSPLKFKVRLVLIARNIQSWWYELMTKNKLVRAFADGEYFSGTQWIAPTASGTSNTKVQFCRAVCSFRTLLGIDDYDVERAALPDFLNETNGEPLYVQMAALAVLRNEHPRSLQALLTATLRREQSVWLRLLKRFQLPDTYLEPFSQAVAAITLLGGAINCARVLDMLTVLPKTRGLSGEERQAFRAALYLSYPRGDGVDALRPDRLGEVLILEEFCRDSQFISTMQDNNATRSELNGMLAVIERICSRGTTASMQQGNLDALNSIQDGLFRQLRPRTSQILDLALRASTGNRKNLVLPRIKDAILKTCSKAGINAEVHERMLSGREVYGQMKARARSFMGILDIFTVTVVVESIPECYLTFGALSQLYKPVPGYFKDHVAVPNEYGCQALISTSIGPYGVPVTLIILTKDMRASADSMPYRGFPGGG